MKGKLYDGLKDAVPDSIFVMLQNAEHMEEIQRSLLVCGSCSAEEGLLRPIFIKLRQKWKV